jgi:hypothetical protein
MIFILFFCTNKLFNHLFIHSFIIYYIEIHTFQSVVDGDEHERVLGFLQENSRGTNQRRTFRSRNVKNGAVEISVHQPPCCFCQIPSTETSHIEKKCYSISPQVDDKIGTQLKLTNNLINLMPSSNKIGIHIFQQSVHPD